jgi:sterol desaturase/sphingolipid hydroxylase (fatty acid hydroxylase superfamily)
MQTTDLLLYATAAVYPLLMLIEHRRPRRKQPALPAWRLIGFVSFLLYASISFYLPLALPASWFEASLLPGASLGVIGGAVVGLLATSLAGYAWHRAAHASPLLWRCFHQLHHAPRRLDVASASIFHPSEMVLYTLLPLTVTTLVLGLQPLAAAIVGLLATFNAVFQHADLRTPRWLSWLIQRPEAHSIHHSAHAWNYSDLPVWDRLFGTYRDRDDFVPTVGFEPAASARWVTMLLGMDAHTPSPAPTPAPATPGEPVSRTR